MWTTINFYKYIIPSLLFLLLPCTSAIADTFAQALSNAAIERTKHHVIYDGSYVSIPYPNGDVAANIGVCTDVVIRAYRALGIDLQQDLHKDISANFHVYPANKIWGQTKPDTNIDHRRVPNLQVFFSRHGDTLVKSDKPEDYRAGDIVTWMLPGNLPHIGIVTHRTKGVTNTPLIAHNIGSGPVLEDILFNYKITGHYRFGGLGSH